MLRSGGAIRQIAVAAIVMAKRMRNAVIEYSAARPIASARACVELSDCVAMVCFESIALAICAGLIVAAVKLSDANAHLQKSISLNG